MIAAVAEESALDSVQGLVTRLQNEFAKLRLRVQELEAENKRPANEQGRLMVALPKAPISDDEIERRLNQGGRSTLQEVLARLEK